MTSREISTLKMGSSKLLSEWVATTPNRRRCLVSGFKFQVSGSKVRVLKTSSPITLLFFFIPHPSPHVAQIAQPLGDNFFFGLAKWIDLVGPARGRLILYRMFRPMCGDNGFP